MAISNEEKIVKDNLGLVHSCCKRFAGRHIEYDDMFQVGCMGLLKAARDFDESLGFKFSTYAVPVILGEIKRLFRDTGAIKVSRSLKELSLKVSATRSIEEQKNGRTLSVSELAEIMGVSPHEINEAICISQPTVSLTVQDDDGVREFDLPSIDNDDNVSNRLLIGNALEKLSETDRKIILLRYFSGLTQSEVALRLNMSQVQVSRREKKLLEEMKIILS